MIALAEALRGRILPVWLKWLAAAAVGIGAYGLGRVHEARRGADAFIEYVGRQAARSTGIAARQAQFVTRVEVKYRDRIQTIYQQGANIEAHIPTYIRPADDERFAVSAGFVRVLDAAWAGAAAGPTAESDGQPAGVPLSDVAAAEVANATSCRAWREQALGWREFYAGQQRAVNGKAGAWLGAPAEVIAE